MSEENLSMKFDELGNNIKRGFNWYFHIIFFIVFLIFMGLGSWYLFIERDNTEEGQWTIRRIMYLLGCLAGIGLSIYILKIPSFDFGDTKGTNIPYRDTICFISIAIFSFFFLLGLDQLNFQEYIGDAVRGIIEWFETRGGFALKILTSLVLLGLFIWGCVYVKENPGSSNTTKGVNIGLIMSGLVMLFIVSTMVMTKMRENKIGTRFFDFVMRNPKSFWGILSMFILTPATALAVHYDNIDFEQFKNAMKRCERNEEDDEGGVKMDTQEEREECKQKAKNDFYNNKIAYTGWPITLLWIFMFFGFVFIERKNIGSFLAKDHFRSLILLISTLVLIAFIVFQIYASRYREGDPNDGEKNYQKNKTEPIINDYDHTVLSITFAIIGFLCLLSLFVVSFGGTDDLRPEHNHLWSSIKWLLKKMGVYSRILFIFFSVLFSLGFVIYLLSSGRSKEFGIVRLIYFGLLLAIMVMVYKFLITRDFFKDNKIFRFLLNIVLFVPCLLFWLIDKIYLDARETPKIVYAVLLGEFVLISLYILIPIAMKIFFKRFNGKNKNVVNYDIQLDEIDKKKEELKSYYEEIQSRVDDVLVKDDWETILTEQYYTSKTEIKNYLERIRRPKIVVDDVNKGEIRSEDENEIRKFSNNPNYRSQSRYDQVVNFVYHLITNQLPDKNYISVQKIKKEEGDLTSKREVVVEKKKKGLLHKSQEILRKPAYLDSEYIPKYVDGKMKNKNMTFQNLESYQMADKHNDFSYNYALSLWINLHTQPPNYRSSYSKYTNILDYGNNPIISYNSDQDTLRVQVLIELPENVCCSTSETNDSCKRLNPPDPSFGGKELEVIKQWCSENMTGNTLNSERQKLITVFEKKNLFNKQKWNNIVINYDLGTLDVFVNSKLVGTWDGTLQKMADKEIKIGHSGGLAGGICNVNYYPSAMKKSQIEFFYESLRLNNPPII